MAAAVAACVVARNKHVAPYPQIYDPVLDSFRVPTVLVLCDTLAASNSGPDVHAALTAAGFTSTLSAQEYYNYVSTDFSAYDTVFWCEGQNYGNPMEPGVDAALAAHVASGNGLVRTGLGMGYEGIRVAGGFPAINPACAAIMPVLKPATTNFGALVLQGANTYAVTRRGLLPRGVPDSVVSAGGYSVLALRSSATLIGSTTHAPSGLPAHILSYTTEFGGCTAFFADLLRFNNVGRVYDATTLQIFCNLALLTAQRVPV